MTAPTGQGPGMPCVCTCHQQVVDSPIARELTTLRIVVIVVISFICGVISGTLTYWGYGMNVAASVLAGLIAMGITFVTAYRIDKG
ncbi:hypothetical protein ACIRG5_19200 [Lentzea sp. NPDC102401]|uniref:hypothetical protein n=1 Tax=Lentzea sp. NPDC102401 TaxID=3364128 RepID=UPI00382A6EC1